MKAENKEIADLKNEMIDLKQENKDFKNEMIDLKQENKDFKNEIIDLKQENKDFKNEIQILGYKNADQTKEINQFQSVINSVDANIFWKNLDGRMMGMNKKNLQSLGLTDIKDALNKKDYEFPNRHANSDQLASNDTKVIKTGESHAFEETITVEGKKDITVLSQKSPLLDENGKLIGVIGVSVDITKQKTIQLELEEALQKIKEKDERRLIAKEKAFWALQEI